MDWIHLAQGRDQWWALTNTVRNRPSGSIKGRMFLVNWVTISFSRRTVLEEVKLFHCFIHVLIMQKLLYNAVVP
jgi:hypothetical protein